jgi:hypothetical protein
MIRLQREVASSAARAAEMQREVYCMLPRACAGGVGLCRGGAMLLRLTGPHFCVSRRVQYPSHCSENPVVHISIAIHRISRDVSEDCRNPYLELSTLKPVL